MNNRTFFSSSDHIYLDFFPPESIHHRNLVQVGLLGEIDCNDHIVNLDSHNHFDFVF